jgi:putative ABC transport system ATP-binding protein
MNEQEKIMDFELEDVWKIYKNGDKIIHALSKINYTFKKGSFNIIHGPSGSGKSTLIRLLGLLESPSMGKLCIKGTNTTDLTKKKRLSLIKKEVGFVFKGSNLIPSINAIENLTLPMITSDTQVAMKILEKVGFYSYNKIPDEMSIEEEQRVSIARALVNNHSIILADEPTGNLHTKEAKKILDLLQHLNRTEALTIIITTNNSKLSKFDGNRVEMVDGTMVN